MWLQIVDMNGPEREIDEFEDGAWKLDRPVCLNLLGMVVQKYYWIDTHAFYLITFTKLKCRYGR